MAKIFAGLLASAISAIFFLPIASFSQSGVIGYADGKKWIPEPYYHLINLANFPSGAQFDRLTHVIDSDIGCGADGALYTGKLPNIWNGSPAANGPAG